MHRYKELKVWQKAVDLTTAVYALSSTLPMEERYGLKNQMQRSSVSIASNIAEGAGRGTDKAFAQFLSTALGSCHELETQLLIAKNVGLISDESFGKISLLIQEISNMTFSLRKSLSNGVSEPQMDYMAGKQLLSTLYFVLFTSLII